MDTRHAEPTAEVKCPEPPAAIEDAEEGLYICWEHIEDYDPQHTCAGCYQQAELENVIALLRRHDNDRLLGIAPPSLEDIASQLRRGEHRR